MTRIRTIIAAAAVSAAALAAAGPAYAGTPTEDAAARSAAAGKDIVATAVAAGNFKTLASLLKQAGLVSTLKGKGKFTVFAPTDAAFAKLPKATLAALKRDKAKLKAVLLFHVAKGSVPASAVVKRSAVKTLNGQSAKVRVSRRQRVRRRRARDHAGRRRVKRRDSHRQQGADPSLIGRDTRRQHPLTEARSERSRMNDAKRQGGAVPRAQPSEGGWRQSSARLATPSSHSRIDVWCARCSPVASSRRSSPSSPKRSATTLCWWIVSRFSWRADDERAVVELAEALDDAADHLAHAVLDEARAAVGLLDDGALVGALHQLVDLARHRALDDRRAGRRASISAVQSSGQPMCSVPRPRWLCVATGTASRIRSISSSAKPSSARRSRARAGDELLRARAGRHALRGDADERRVPRSEATAEPSSV